MANIIISANGTPVDMEALRLKNETVVAVGNMQVNARGDELDANTGQVVRNRNERIADYYKLNSPIPVAREFVMEVLPDPEPVVAEVKTVATKNKNEGGK